MGEVVPFQRRQPKKLTGFLPPIVANPPRALSYDPISMAFMPIIAMGLFASTIIGVWFGEGWRDR